VKSGKKAISSVNRFDRILFGCVLAIVWLRPRGVPVEFSAFGSQLLTDRSDIVHLCTVNVNDLQQFVK